MLDKIPTLKPLRTTDEYKELTDKAEKDGKHFVLDPTHLMVKEGKIVGYFSLGATPLVNCWFSTEEITERDAALLINQAIAISAGQQPKRVIVPCPRNSPFHSLLTEERGFVNAGDYTLFIKEV